MKFLFEFVSCCVPVNMSRIENPEETEAAASKEMRTLAPITTRKHRRRKRSALLPSAAAKLAADWKPSLGAISEDKVVLVVMEREKSDDQAAELERSVKRKSGSRDGESRVHGRKNSNDFSLRQNPSAIPVVIPAFSPAPFLF
ncbi:uncharacterized protein LOC103493394 [Cucumis melo]|uniref:Uncharacterized protein LOC103493394 n=2 Tax=Cucumis melo TaxID=3656 RepID=A0A1S3BTM8_CUCME|nr:uncharacterized protein LOC103493394 [Cucumis melo]